MRQIPDNPELQHSNGLKKEAGALSLMETLGQVYLLGEKGARN